MLFVTGDVHHRSLETRDQACLGESEISLAGKYAAIANEYGVKVTLFVSGKTAKEEPETVRSVAEMENVELGGHNWNCFEWSVFHRLSDLLLNTYYGPQWYQQWDIQHTLDKIESCTSIRPQTWRSHAFIDDEQTHEVLAANDVRVVSNTVDRNKELDRLDSGLVSLPVNVLPDHSNMYHGWLSKQYVRRQLNIIENGPVTMTKLGRRPTKAELIRTGKEIAKTLLGKQTNQSFDQEWYTPEEWVTHVEEQLTNRIDQQGFATVLAHPACMEIADSMDTFERLCSAAEKVETGFVSDATSLAQDSTLN